MMPVSHYAKFVVTLIAAVLVTAVQYLGDNHMSAQEITTSIVAGLTAVGVYVVPNKRV